MFTVLKLYLQEPVDREQILSRLIAMGYTRVTALERKGDCAQRGETLDIYPVNYELPCRVETAFDRIEGIYTFNPAQGTRVADQNPLVVLPRGNTAGALTPPAFFLNTFEGIQAGDFVVHLDHGIGKYLGIRRLKTLPHIAIEYAGGDVIYVPIKEKNLVQRYIGFAGTSPQLHRIGGKSWHNAKERARQGIQSFALELLTLQAKRALLRGTAFNTEHPWQQEFERRFAYTPTPDQDKAWQETKADMQTARPMDRLLCGDVGYGKTEVAFRAAFKAALHEKQVAILTPTTILAEQHFHNLSARTRDFPITVAMLSRFKTDAEQKQIIAALRKGGIDIVIGTHRLLSDDITFSNLGLMIIDEEQRFGVKAKERLKKICHDIDVLTLTATPIPRTLYLSLLGIRDMSLITTAPENRLAISTFVCAYDEEIIRSAVANELARGGQVYIIHNRISDIEEFADRIRRLAPQARLAVGHGQMPESHLEAVMLNFIARRIDILVSTTIVESGLDIPHANTLIVDHAEQFGLADLYQLRGRIGRLDQQAYAYFLTPRNATFNPTAQRRLQSIQKFTALGAGFKIAMEDLEIRGAGNLLGEEQHGYIVTVGFDLYCQLLEQSVAQLKTTLSPEQTPR